MRRLMILGPLCLLVATGAAQDKQAAAPAQPPPAEKKPELPAHDDLGFPVTFNDEIITRNDVVRSLGQPSGDIETITLRNQRDLLLQRKLSERVAAELGVVVEDKEVDQILRRTIDLEGGDAKFYESLAQKGLSLERYRLDLRQLVLENKLRFLFEQGYSSDGRKLLPWRVRATPRETRIAFENDAARRTAGLRVRRLEMVVDLDKKARAKIVAQAMAGGKPEAWLKEQIRLRLEEDLRSVLGELETGRSFAELAKARGVDVERLQDEWVEVPRQQSRNPTERFLQQAKRETYSAPIERAGGGYLILYLLERESPGDLSVTDPKVAQEYETRIRALRAQKWDAVMRLRALDNSTVQPDRVRDDLRKDLLALLKDAELGLRALALH